MTVALDKKVPDFKAASTGGEFRLSPLKGSTVVLYFYPKDNTPGCTTEGTDFRDRHAKFARRGAVVVGVSRDTLKSHEGFKAKMGFPFELLSDADEKLCAQFGVIKMKNMYGKKVRGIERSTFVIDGDGRARARMARRQGAGPRRGGAGVRAVDRLSRHAACRSLSSTTARCPADASADKRSCQARHACSLPSRPNQPATIGRRRRRLHGRAQDPSPRPPTLVASQVSTQARRQAGPKPRAVVRPKLFVLDTNVLMHDPTSLFRFEEHDIYLPILTLEELDNNKKGMTEVARNARQASRFLDELVAAMPDGDRRGHSARRAKSGGAATGRLFLQTEVDHDRAAAPRSPTARPTTRSSRSSCTCSTCTRSATSILVSKDINMRIKARALGHRRRGLLQRQGARGHRPPLHRHARAAGGFLGQARQGHGVLAAGRPHVLPDHRPARRRRCCVNEFLYQEKPGEQPLYALVKEIAGTHRGAADAQGLHAPEEQRLGHHGAQPRAELRAQPADEPGRSTSSRCSARPAPARRC